MRWTLRGDCGAGNGACSPCALALKAPVVASLGTDALRLQRTLSMSCGGRASWICPFPRHACGRRDVLVTRIAKSYCRADRRRPPAQHRWRHAIGQDRRHARRTVMPACLRRGLVLHGGHAVAISAMLPRRSSTCHLGPWHWQFRRCARPRRRVPAARPCSALRQVATIAIPRARVRAPSDP